MIFMKKTNFTFLKGFALSTAIAATMWAGDVNAQAIACQDHVNVSLDATCGATLAPANFTALGTGTTVVIMNGATSYGAPVASVVVAKTGAGAYTINAVAAGNIIGNTYTVKVSDAGGNSCWGTLKFEDKLAPVIACPGDITVNCDKDGATTAAATDCSSFTLTSSDVVTEFPCPTPYPATGVYTTKEISRTFLAIDAYGNQSTCVQKITFQRPIWETGGANVTVTVDNKNYECSATAAQLAPTVAGAGAPSIKIGGVTYLANIACDLMVTSVDQQLPTCGTGYKIIRTWTVLDWCKGESKTATQIIKVEDTQAPTAAALSGTLTLSTSANACKLNNTIVPFPAFTDACDDQLTKTVKVKAGAVVVYSGSTTGSTAIINNLAIGTYTIEYTATDRCGNAGTVSQPLEVKDLVPPTPVCDLDTKVSLTIDGKAVVNASSFDDGSVDNCCLDANRFEASKDGSTFGSTVTFDCKDKTLMVTLRVWDCYGNSNTCMVNVTVEDKLNPVIFAASTSVICGDNTTADAWLNANEPKVKTINDYPTATNPGFYDNCGAKVTKSTSGTINNCGVGTVTRIYTATDDNGRTATAQQTYSSVNASAYRVEFPADKSLNCPVADPYAKDAVKITNLGNPGDVTSVTCPVVSVECEDQTFLVNGNNAAGNPQGCYKILRKWKVMNFCQLTTNPSVQQLELMKGPGAEWVKKAGVCGAVVPRTYTNIAGNLIAPASALVTKYAPLVSDNSCYAFDTDGYMEYVQVILVNDVVAPVWATTPDPICSTLPNCEIGVDLPAPTATDCTNDLAYSYQILDATNTVVTYGTFPAAQYKITKSQFGKYTVRYKVTDKCGNYTSTDKVLDIKDKKKPTPVCYQGLSISLMPSTGMATLQATQFDAGSYDNCTAYANLKFRIESPATKGTVSTTPPSATELNVNCKGLKLIRLWAIDEAGNADYCDTYVDVQYPWEGAPGAAVVSACPPVSGADDANIAGAIKTEAGSSMTADVSVTPLGFSNPLYTFPGKAIFLGGVNKGSDVKITAKNDANPKNGISTFDLVLINKHILGAQLLDSPYKKIAADVNGSKTITTADLVELRKLILGINDKFTNNTSWKFIDKKQALTTANVFTTGASETINIANIQGDVLDADFVAVKIGDVNASAATLGAPRNNNATVAIVAEDQAVKAGQEVRMTLTASEIEAYQFTMNYNAAALELVNVEAAAENFAVIAEGKITASSMTNEGMTVVFRAKQAGQLSNLVNINSDVTTAEAYNAGTTYNVVLGFNNAANGFELYQNTPNPAKGATTISFNLPQAGAATLTITDMAGRTVNVINVDGVKGYNEAQVTNLAAGVFQYTLQSANNTATKKMVIIE